jgi:hypothetical protein
VVETWQPEEMNERKQVTIRPEIRGNFDFWPVRQMCNTAVHALESANASLLIIRGWVALECEMHVPLRKAQQTHLFFVFILCLCLCCHFQRCNMPVNAGSSAENTDAVRRCFARRILLSTIK